LCTRTRRANATRITRTTREGQEVVEEVIVCPAYAAQNPTGFRTKINPEAVRAID
jgi:hypothetical protein